MNSEPVWRTIAVMVFPQGIFSEEAIPELKHATFNAVVNTEVHSNPLAERKLRISDVWDVAVMTLWRFPDLHPPLSSSRHRELRL